MVLKISAILFLILSHLIFALSQKYYQLQMDLIINNKKSKHLDWKHHLSIKKDELGYYRAYLKLQLPDNFEIENQKKIKDPKYNYELQLRDKLAKRTIHILGKNNKVINTAFLTLKLDQDQYLFVSDRNCERYFSFKPIKKKKTWYGFSCESIGYGAYHLKANSILGKEYQNKKIYPSRTAEILNFHIESKRNIKTDQPYDYRFKESRVGITNSIQEDRKRRFYTLGFLGNHSQELSKVELKLQGEIDLIHSRRGFLNDWFFLNLESTFYFKKLFFERNSISVKPYLASSFRIIDNKYADLSSANFTVGSLVKYKKFSISPFFSPINTEKTYSYWGVQGSVDILNYQLNIRYTRDEIESNNFLLKKWSLNVSKPF